LPKIVLGIFALLADSVRCRAYYQLFTRNLEDTG